MNPLQFSDRFAGGLIEFRNLWQERVCHLPDPADDPRVIGIFPSLERSLP